MTDAPSTPAPPSRGSTRACTLVRHLASGAVSAADVLSVEEPLEVRIAGEPLSVTMRTPGHDEELVLGFLFAEGIIGGVRDVGRVARCGRPGDAGYGNVVDVTAAPGTTLDPGRGAPGRRGTLTTSACGVCGRQSVDDLLARCRPVERRTVCSGATVSRLARGLLDSQPGFARTGGLHAAGIATPDGDFLVVREDVGRHNAVDKAIGRSLLDGRVPLSAQVLVVSGRASFEIVQKAAVAGVPMVISVSAPSTLAVEVAERAGITLVGFARADTFNVYTHPGGVSG